jgi:hypothetical protein
MKGPRSIVPVLPTLLTLGNGASYSGLPRTSLTTSRRVMSPRMITPKVLWYL